MSAPEGLYGASVKVRQKYAEKDDALIALRRWHGAWALELVYISFRDDRRCNSPLGHREAHPRLGTVSIVRKTWIKSVLDA